MDYQRFEFGAMLPGHHRYMYSLRQQFLHMPTAIDQLAILQLEGHVGMLSNV
jgi:hypothetical protein